MASKLRILGVVLIVVGLVAWGAAGYAYLRYQDGSNALEGFSEAQNVTLSYNADGDLTDRGTTEGADAILELLGEEWSWPIDKGELNPDNPVVNTATEYMYQMATIAHHTLTGVQNVVLTERVEWDGNGDGVIGNPEAATDETAEPEASMAPAESTAPEESMAPAESMAPEESMAPAEASEPDVPTYSGGEWDPATAGEDAIFLPGTYQVPVNGRYWTGFNRLHPLDGPAREQAWNGTVHGLFAELGVGATTATSLQLAFGVIGVTFLMGLGFIISGGGMIWAGSGGKKEE